MNAPSVRSVVRRLVFLLMTWLAAAFVSKAAETSARPKIDFNREVRPILSENCFACHGPDDKQRKAKLRLDNRADAFKKLRKDGFAIVPGKPATSKLLARVTAADPSERMPPAKTGKQLTPLQLDLLRRWIEEGAAWSEHWAFAPPQQAPLPAVKQKEWPRNAIDHFVLAGLEARRLEPSPAADRYTLARRVSLDLIGLPPTPEEADRFANDPAPDAYERLVDRLLASPHYGERWARRWLDLARYADTNGYEKDRTRSIWPYRDWVIQALNADLPFDRFTIEQIAGDLLPGATLQQRIATGLHRNTMLNEEGGIDPLEFRFHAMTDRVSTTARVWLGLTVGCAQCHSHKYDPIPQREYYQFFAFLNNADEPEIDVPQPDLTARRQELDAQIAARNATLPERFPAFGRFSRQESFAAQFAIWLERESARAIPWTVLHPKHAVSTLARLTILDDHSILASGDQNKREVYEVTFQGDWKHIQALRLEALPDERLPKHGPGRIFYEGPFGDFFLSEISLAADGRPRAWEQASSSFASGKSMASAAIDGDTYTGWSINGGQGKAHAAVFVLKQPLPEAMTLKVQLLFEKYYAAGLGRFRLSAQCGPPSGRAQAEARGLPAEIEEILLLPEDQRTEAQRQELFQHYLSVAPELAGEREALQRLRESVPASPTTLVFAERPPDNPRPTHIHRRGEFLQPAERVEPAVLSVLPALPPDLPRNRLTFARWLVDPSNPLVGRVTMNRHWATFFGRGLVRTVEDFGYQGDAPTHPELLDWLAVELVRQGWSMKQMHRLLVTSATYQQSSRVTPELLLKDSDNQWLSRGPRSRLEAEPIRDAALKSSGLLAPKIGGPSVFPPQPAGVTTEGTFGGFAWQASAGTDRYRRGLYTFSKRTAPYAMFNTFDGPSGEACVVRREVSNTPLQALTLLNDAVFLEAAQALGRSIAAQPTSVKLRARDLFRRCLTRPPSDDELSLLVVYVREQQSRLANKELKASEIAGGGGPDVEERAAWTLAARALLNLDEAIMKN